MRNETYTGLWWLPADPDRKLSGRLETSISEPPRLSLVGAFAPVEEMASRNDYPVVQGFTDNGKRITLVHCQTATHNFNAPGFPTQELIASAALVGGHFPTPESVAATVTYAEFTFLQEWLGPGAFQEEFPEGGDTITVRYSRRALPVVAVGAGGDVEIVTGWRTRGDRIRQRTIEATSSVKVSWSGALEKVIQDRLAPVQDLLTLGTDHPNRMTRLQFRSAEAEQNRDDDLIEAIFPVNDSTPPRRAPTVHDMLFAYPHVEDVFPTLLAGWFDVHTDLADVCALYFTVRRAQPAPLEVTFLTLVRALEVFDRARNGNNVRPKAQHKAFIKTLIDAAPEAARKWLTEKLAFSNEPTLRDRVTRLLDKVGEVMDPIAGERVEFAKRLADTRNYYTHYDESGRKKAATGEEPSRLNQRLIVFIAALLLHATGLEAPRVTALFRQNQSYVWLMRIQSGHED